MFGRGSCQTFFMKFFISSIPRPSLLTWNDPTWWTTSRGSRLEIRTYTFTHFLSAWMCHFWWLSDSYLHQQQKSKACESDVMWWYAIDISWSCWLNRLSLWCIGLHNCLQGPLSSEHPHGRKRERVGIIKAMSRWSGFEYARRSPSVESLYRRPG